MVILLAQNLLVIKGHSQEIQADLTLKSIV